MDLSEHAPVVMIAFSLGRLQKLPWHGWCGMRTKAEFIKEWMEAESEGSESKSWRYEQPGKTFLGAPSFYIFVDMDYFGLLSQVGWVPSAYRTAAIPYGFVTNFASVPRVFWSLLPPDRSLWICGALSRLCLLCRDPDYAAWPARTADMPGFDHAAVGIIRSQTADGVINGMTGLHGRRSVRHPAAKNRTFG
jgi:hypothetical protein